MGSGERAPMNDLRKLLRGSLAAGILLASVPGWPATKSHARTDGSIRLQTLVVMEGFKVRYPSDWSLAPREYANVHQLRNIGADRARSPEAGTVARISILNETGRDHADALRRL